MGALAARVAGPLEPFAHGFLAWLLEQGYSPSVVGVRIRLVVKLSAWMEVGGVSPRGLTPQLMEQFLVPERAFCGGQQWCSSTSVRQLLDYLRGLRVVPEAPAPVISDPVELLVGRFAEFLVRERGIVDMSTVRRYQQAARRFLSGLVAASRSWRPSRANRAPRTSGASGDSQTRRSTRCWRCSGRSSSVPSTTATSSATQ